MACNGGGESGDSGIGMEVPVAVAVVVDGVGQAGVMPTGCPVVFLMVVLLAVAAGSVVEVKLNDSSN